MADEVKNDEKAEGKNENAEKEEDGYKERLIRLAAEFDNYKKRVKSDIDVSKTIGKAELVRDLLPVLDEFEIALIAMRQGSDKTMVKGFELLYSNFLGTLKKVGLREIKTDGRFDPYMHEIMLAQEDDSEKPGTILEVTKKGYMLGEILLRPASVIIAKEKQNDAKTTNENKQ